MLKQIQLLLFLFSALTGSAQRVVDVNKENANTLTLVYAVGGVPFSNAKYIRIVEGSPYYNPDWMRGSVMLKDSNEYINILLRLDLIENTVEYIDKTGAQMLATTPIRQLRLVDSSTGKSVCFVHSSYIASTNIEPGWFQLLVSGKVSLFKKHVKEVLESKPYGSATIEQRINTVAHYFLLSGNTFTLFKKIKDVPALLADKKSELHSRITANKLSGKTDGDFSDLILYYNQLNTQ